MEQISLENKVNNTLKWLANQVACVQIYPLDDEFKKKSLSDASSNDPNYFYKAVPKNTIYPIRVIVPSWIDISTWNLPYETEIVHI